KTLIKATLVNSFYGARAGSRDIDNITSWLVAKEPDILREYHDLIDNEEVRIQFVQQIATYGRDKDIEGCIVFASKFAHFFIDPETFPIYDQYACMMVNFHLGKSDKGLSTREKYTDFHKNFFQFKRYLEQEYHD